MIKILRKERLKKNQKTSNTLTNDMLSWRRFLVTKCCCISISAAISPRSAGPTSRHNSLPTLDVTEIQIQTYFCTECSDFEISKFKPVPPPDNYPKEVHPQSPPLPENRPVGPTVTLGVYFPTFRNQIMAWNASRHNYTTNLWNEKKHYLLP